MSDHKSLENLLDFRRRIDSMVTDPSDEEFVRDFCSKAALACPMDALIRIAVGVWLARKDELEREAKGN